MAATRDELSLRQGAPFQRRVASVALITTAAVLLTACLAFVGLQWSGERRSLADHHGAMAAVVAQHAADGFVEGRPGESTALVRSLAEAPDVRGAFIIDTRGMVVASYGRAIEAGSAPPAETADAAQVRRPMIAPDGRVIGQLVILSDLGRLAPLVAKYLAVSGAMFFAASGLAMFLSRWLASRLIRPVNALSHAMLDLADSGDFTKRAPLVPDPVFARLTESFNHLLDRLQLNDQKLRHTLRDLTVARDAAETANVLKSQFLANMSHEIRTPLNGVLAMAQLMERSVLDAEQRERLTVIRGSGEALLAVLNDVLDLSKIEAGKLELESVEFDLAELARSVEQTYAPLTAEKGLRIELRLEPSALGVRRGDPGRLKQVLNNLTSNAIKFTPSGVVTLAFEGLGADGAQGLSVSVVDTGVGIAQEKLPSLFEKFTQVDNSATRRFGGTGLGLAISRELATLMGGRISVRSKVGHGSSFRLDIPLVRTGEALTPVKVERPAAAAEVDSGDSPPVRILAAEDNPTNQRVLRAVLDTFDVDLTLVENGRLAVEAWRTGGYDLVLMDIQMPAMDGVEATQTIRAVERAEGRRRTPIVALSANAMTHQVSEYLAAGMDAHVAKPIEIGKLQAAIVAALDGGDDEAVVRAA